MNWNRAYFRDINTFELPEETHEERTGMAGEHRPDRDSSLRLDTSRVPTWGKLVR